MLQRFTKLIALAALASTTPLMADTAQARVGFDQSAELPPYLQCVPYAREQSGIEIYGDAHTWWDQAKGKFKRGNTPKRGAVMAFQPHRNMELGHVAAVSKVIDSRTVLLRHSNWSPINGRRGQIENDVRAVDVSRNNDWSEVRVWYAPVQGLGKTVWPIHGFIYSDKAPKFEKPSFTAPIPQPVTRVARASQPAAKPQFSAVSMAQPLSRQPVSRAPSRQFTIAFSDLSAKPSAKANPPRVRAIAPQQRPAQQAKQQPSKARSSVDQRVKSAISLYD